MKKAKITALALGLIIGAGALSGCSEESETPMEYIDVAALAGVSPPVISAVNFENGGGNSSAESGLPSTANSGNSSGDNSSGVGSGETSDNSSAANSNNSNSSQSGEQSSNSSGSGASSNDSTSSISNESKTADVVIPNVNEYGVYIARFSEFDPEKVKTAILGDVSVTPDVFDLHDNHNDVDYKVYEWNNGDVTLYVNSHSLVFDLTSELSYLVNHIFWAPNYNSDGNIEEYKRLDEPLDFCTPEQAVNDIRGKLARCGVNVSANADVYALHQDEMQRMVDERCAKGHFYDPKVSLKGLDAKPLTSYPVDKSDECYYIVFNEEFSGVPVYNYQFHYKTIKDLTIFHPEITAVYSSDGLMGLMVSEYRGNITESEKVTQLITPESAVQAITAKYSDMGASKVEFDKVELMYALTPNTIDGKINIFKAKLTPAWVCTIYYTEWRKDKRVGNDGQVTLGEGYVTSKETVLIDAVTGTEII